MNLKSNISQNPPCSCEKKTILIEDLNKTDPCNETQFTTVGGWFKTSSIHVAVVQEVITELHCHIRGFTTPLPKKLNYKRVFNEQQERDLILYFQISEIFTQFLDFKRETGICSPNPEVLLNSYRSVESNFEWRSFDGDSLNYTGHLDYTGDLDLDYSDLFYTSFGTSNGTSIFGKSIIANLIIDRPSPTNGI